MASDMAEPTDKTAFVQLVQQEFGIINHLAMIYYHTESDREDCRQDVILQLWKSYPTFKHKSAIGTWIYAVALRTILKKKRKERRSLQTETLERSTFTSTMGYVDDDLQLLHKLIDNLSPSDRALVILYLEGYKQKEMAKMLDLTHSNVSTRLSRIKSKLQKNFKLKFYEP